MLTSPWFSKSLIRLRIMVTPRWGKHLGRCPHCYSTAFLLMLICDLRDVSHPRHTSVDHPAVLKLREPVKVTHVYSCDVFEPWI
jgi:hypothetical protein